jgi:hypothetical protein
MLMHISILHILFPQMHFSASFVKQMDPTTSASPTSSSKITSP